MKKDATYELLARRLAFDPTPAGLVTAPLRKAFKYYWSVLRKEHFSEGDFSCAICSAMEEKASLIHAHEVYSFPNPKIVKLERILFICSRCHDAIHFERSRARCQAPYVQILSDHYCRLNGDLTEKEFKLDCRLSFEQMLSIREFYGGSEAKPILDYGPFQAKTEDILADRTWRKLGFNRRQ